MADEENEQTAATAHASDNVADAVETGDATSAAPAERSAEEQSGTMPQSDTTQNASSSAADGEPDEAAYKVTLPSFHGPLDLLLHLIRKHEVDIYDIPIALITEQYNAYLDAMVELDLDIAADYVYMAALLINIKSRMLLPREEGADDDGDDPRKELVDRLLEYQRFKAVAESFAELDVVRMGMWSRPRVSLPGAEEPADIDMTDVSLFDLIDAFRTALVRYQQNHPQAIELQRTVHKISDKMVEIYEKLKEKSPIRLQWFLEGRDRNELIAVFLGMLELVRLGGISLQQSDIFGEILMSKGAGEIDAATFALFDNS